MHPYPKQYTTPHRIHIKAKLCESSKLLAEVEQLAHESVIWTKISDLERQVHRETVCSYFESCHRWRRLKRNVSSLLLVGAAQSSQSETYHCPFCMHIGYTICDLDLPIVTLAAYPPPLSQSFQLYFRFACCA